MSAETPQVDIYKKFRIPNAQPFDSNLTVFVAEEHNELRLIISHHLNKLGFNKVRTCRDGRTALAELQNTPADLAIVGEDLPQVSGLDLLRELREDPKIERGAFILMTKPVSKAELMLSIESGVDEFLIRPIVPADILGKIRTAYQTFNNPKNPERAYEFAKAKLRTNELELAKQVYLTLAQSAGKAARPLVGLARIALMQKQVDDALRHATEAVTRNANYVHGWTMRGEVNVAIGKQAEALEDFKKSVAISPLNVARYEKCCEMMLAQGMIDPCIQILEDGVKSGLEDPYITERLGHCHFRKKDFAVAAKFLKKAVELEPKNTAFMNSLAICYRDSKEFEKSIGIYNQILKQEPENFHVMFNKALVLLLTQQQNDAIKLLRRALRVDPSFEKAKDKLRDLGAPFEAPGEDDKQAG